MPWASRRWERCVSGLPPPAPDRSRRRARRSRPRPRLAASAERRAACPAILDPRSGRRERLPGRSCTRRTPPRDLRPEPAGSRTMFEHRPISSTRAVEPGSAGPSCRAATARHPTWSKPHHDSAETVPPLHQLPARARGRRSSGDGRRGRTGPVAHPFRDQQTAQGSRGADRRADVLPRRQDPGAFAGGCRLRAVGARIPQRPRPGQPARQGERVAAET